MLFLRSAEPRIFLAKWPCQARHGVANSLCMVPTKHYGQQMDPEERLRHKWAESLAEHMEFRSINKKELLLRLDELGVSVTRQAIESWLAGKTAPRPHYQAALGTVFDVPVRRLFPIENLPAKAAS